MSSKSSIYNYLPIHLRGEIIQIGAVKMNDDWTPGEEFQIDVKPVYFRKMHYRVKKLTGIDFDRLSNACGFKEAFAQFRSFCGDDCTFYTWGYDDKGIMEQNIIVHDLDWDWISGWVNLQVIFNLQTDGDNNQKSLATAMEHYSIEQTRVAHDALGDAYNTALVCSKLNMDEGLKGYSSALHHLSTKAVAVGVNDDNEQSTAPEAVEHLTYQGYNSREALFEDNEIKTIRCPVCGEAMFCQRWINQGDKRYMSLANCQEHGDYLARLKVRLTEEETWTANKILYKADEGMISYYKSKAQQAKKKSHRRKAKVKTSLKENHQ